MASISTPISSSSSSLDPQPDISQRRFLLFQVVLCGVRLEKRGEIENKCTKNENFISPNSKRKWNELPGYHVDVHVCTDGI